MFYMWRTTVRYLTILFSLFLAVPARAIVRTVTEGVATTNYVLKVDTTNVRVSMGKNYPGSISNVALYVSSNMVVGNCVIYSTGSDSCGEFNTFASSKTFKSNVLVASSVTASSFFGDGSHLTGIPSTGSFSGVYVLKSGDDMSGQLTNSSSITITGANGLKTKQITSVNGALYISTSIVVASSSTFKDVISVTSGATTVDLITAKSSVGSTLFKMTSQGGTGRLSLLDGTNETIRFDTFAGKSWISYGSGFFGIGTVNPSFALDVTTDVRVGGSGLALSVPNGNVNIGAAGNTSSGVRLQVQGGTGYFTQSTTSLVSVGRIGAGLTNPSQMLDVEGSVLIGLGTSKSSITAAGYATFLGDVTAVNHFGNGATLSGIPTLGDNYFTGAQSIRSTNTSSHATYPLTIGNLAVTDNVGIALRSSDTTHPIIFATINDGATSIPVDIHNGVDIGGSGPLSVNSAGLTIWGTGGITSQFGVTFTTRTQNVDVSSGAMLVGGGARFGCGSPIVDGCGVQTISKDGRIVSLSTTYFQSVDGSSLTNINDSTKVLKTGDTMSGTLTMSNNFSFASLTGNINFTDNFYHSIVFKSTGGPQGWPVGQIQFVQGGTGLHRIISFDGGGVYPGQLVLGADQTATAANGNLGVRLTGNASQTPDIYVSTYNWVSIGTSSPVVSGVSTSSAAGLYVAGPVISTASVIATYGVVATTGVFTSTLTVRGSQFSVGGSTFSITNGSTTIGGMLLVGYITSTTNSCIAATSCSVTCPIGTYRIGAPICGTGAGVAMGGQTVTNVSGTCTGITVTTINIEVDCARIQ